MTLVILFCLMYFVTNCYIWALKNQKLKNVILFAICSLFLVGCRQKEKQNSEGFNNRNVENLFKKISNTDLNNNQIRNYNQKIHYLISGNNDSLSRHYMFKLAENYFNIGDYERCLQISREVGIKSKKANDLFGIIRSNYFIANYHYFKFNMDSAYYYYSKAEKISLKINEQPYLAPILYSKANLLYLKKDFTRSEVLTIKALKIALKDKDYMFIYNCYLNLGNVLLGMNNYDKAIEYYQKVLESSEKLKSKYQYLSFKAQPYLYLGKVYQKKRSYLKAIKCFEKGLSLANFKEKDPTLYCYLMSNLAYSKMRMGDSTADESLKEILSIAENIKNIPVEITCKKYLSESYLFQIDVQKAIFYGNEARKMAHKNKIFEDELTCLEMLAKIDHKNHTVHTSRFIALTDSLQNVERAARDKYARIEFETDEIIKEKNYVMSERDYLSAQRWAILIFSVLMISILTLWYVVNLQKSKNKELQFIQEQQRQNEEIYQLMLDHRQKLEEGKQLEKKRISQELHDGVMGRLSGIRLNLFALSRRTDPDTIAKCLEQVPRLQEIEREIRNISHNLNNDMFSEKTNFNQLIKGLFQDMRSHSKLQYEMAIDPEIDWENINNYAKINIYRIIQEALFNIDKYAQAQIVYLKMKSLDDGMMVFIEDDGVGFDLQKVKDGIGLKNMKSRIADLDGKIEIESSLGTGTKINFSIPT